MCLIISKKEKQYKSAPNNKLSLGAIHSCSKRQCPSHLQTTQFCESNLSIQELGDFMLKFSQGYHAPQDGTQVLISCPVEKECTSDEVWCHILGNLNVTSYTGGNYFLILFRKVTMSNIFLRSAKFCNCLYCFYCCKQFTNGRNKSSFVLATITLLTFVYSY